MNQFKTIDLTNVYTAQTPFGTLYIVADTIEEALEQSNLMVRREEAHRAEYEIDYINENLRTTSISLNNENYILKGEEKK